MAGVTTSYQTGVHGSRPAASAGCILYSCTTHGLIYRSDGTSWTTFLTLPSALTDPMTTRGDLIYRDSANATARLPIGSSGKVLSSNGTDVSWQTPAAAELPWLIDINVYPTAIAHVNWDTLFNDAANNRSLSGFMKDSSGAQNDEINWDVVLGAGTWTLEIVHFKTSDRGIYTASLAGTDVGTVDGYAAAAAANQRGAITGIAVASSAKYRLRLKMSTHNGSSSSYKGSLHAVQLRRTA